MGRFADVHITGFSDAELDAFEQLLEIPDQQAFAWITGAEDVPADFDTPMFRRLRDFHMSNDGTS